MDNPKNDCTKLSEMDVNLITQSHFFRSRSVLAGHSPWKRHWGENSDAATRAKLKAPLWWALLWPQPFHVWNSLMALQLHKPDSSGNIRTQTQLKLSRLECFHLDAVMNRNRRGSFRWLILQIALQAGMREKLNFVSRNKSYSLALRLVFSRYLPALFKLIISSARRLIARLKVAAEEKGEQSWLHDVRQSNYRGIISLLSSVPFFGESSSIEKSFMVELRRQGGIAQSLFKFFFSG